MNFERTILLVDDNPTTLALYSSTLEKAGFEVIRKSSSNATIEFLLKHRDSVHLMICSILILRHRNWELMSYLRKDCKLDEMDFPVIVMSPIEGLEMEYIKNKVSDWITTPIHPVDLITDHAVKLLGLHMKGFCDG